MNSAGQPVDPAERLPADVLTAWMKAAFAAAFPDAPGDGPDLSVLPATRPEFGDFQCNAAMQYGKAMKQPPRRVAEAAKAAAAPSEIVDRIEVAGPGFINLFVKDSWLVDYVRAMTGSPRLGVPDVGQGRTVVMDYGSPNMSKPLHIGHLRSPNIGSALDRLHRFLGYRVVSDNHLGDWGTQFGITLMGFRHFGDEGAMEREPMEELERVYVLSYQKGQQDPDWLDQCRRELVKLQSGDEENVRLWRHFMELSLRELDRIYGRLGVRYDLVRGESYYQNDLQGVVDALRNNGTVRESEGALVAFLELEGLPPAIVRKRDGGFNYATTDIATVRSRVREFDPDRIVYLTDERQQLHFRQVFAICRRLGIRTGLHHVWFGLMRLPEGAFSTRQGNVIRLEALLDEAERRALDIVERSSPEMEAERKREVARAVGVGAVKYADLSQNPETLVTFTWEKALALDGNSGPYLQYACARIASVKDRYAERFPGVDLSDHPIRITDPIERALVLRLSRFPDAVLRAAHSFRPCVLAEYLYDLAQTYSTFYQNVPFLKAEEGVRESRVNLCATVARVLGKGLELLGIETPARI